MEMDGIEDLIMNQNFDKEDFLDRSNYDLSEVYKRYFYNFLSEECEDIPKFLSKVSKYADDSISNMAQNYYIEKVGKLLQAILILKNITEE